MLVTPRTFAPSAALALVLATAACGSPEVSVTELAELAELAPPGARAVATDVIFPRPEGGASRFLVRNWPPIQTLEGDVLWVTGTWAELGFFAVADEPPALFAEARPFAATGTPQQSFEVLVNGAPVRTVAMEPGWRDYEVALPAQGVKPGWNVVELRFAHSLRPADFDPSSDDRRTLAAAFRRLEMRHASGREPWRDGPATVTASPAHALTASTPTATGAPAAASAPAGELTPSSIEMPTDSLLEVYVAPADAAQLLGSLRAEFIDGTAGGSIRALVDTFDDAATTRVFSAELTPARPTAELGAALAPWAGRAVGLRLRVVGNRNGVVHWRELRLEQPADEPPGPYEIVAPPRSAALGRPDVFVILLDAARADAFAGARGAELAPEVTALAADGTRFAHAWAPSSWTGQTIPALWSGFAPDAIGAEHWGSRLPASVVTFPEMLYEAGYHTVLWSQHTLYNARPGLRNGFETYEYAEIVSPASRADLPDVAAMLDERRPTLAVLHLIPPHEPYNPPPPFRGSRSSWYDDEVPITAETLNRLDQRVAPDDAALRDKVRRAAIAKYEENVAFADHLVGRLVEGLRRAGRYDSSLIVVTSDHGEAFLEHGRFLHTKALYEEYVRVPLVLKWPAGFSGFETVVDTPVSLLDLAPTLIDGLGIDDQRAAYQGRSLLPPATGTAADGRVLYAYTSGVTDPEAAPRPQRALLWRGRKLLVDGAAGQASVYDLDADPGETAALTTPDDVATRWLLQALMLTEVRNAAHLLASGGAINEELDEETIRRLRALGYLR